MSPEAENLPSLQRQLSQRSQHSMSLLSVLTIQNCNTFWQYLPLEPGLQTGRSMFPSLAKQHIAKQGLCDFSARHLDVYFCVFGWMFLESMEEDRSSMQSKSSVKLIPISYKIAIEGHGLLSHFFWRLGKAFKPYGTLITVNKFIK